ncbi:MAG: CBS domain-containing protein, partial [Methanomicrobiales archaeon]|nr:CBS domain-containing protein [Methanomicrobiales archaeon]
MLVADAMTKDPVTCPADTPLRDAVALFRKHHIGGLPVMDGRELVGMVTESDIIALLESERISDDLWLPSPFEIIEIPIREFINWE